jgi:hypothetical protein
LGLACLAACGAIKIHPDPQLPTALLQPLTSDVGLIIPPEQLKYTHKETRWDVDWEITLGAGHQHLMEEVFKDEFSHVQEFKDLDSARAASGLKALFEPRIDQYSFVTSEETGGRYYAVTIRYRINLYTPRGDKADTLTLTGYGNALASGLTSSSPLLQATLAAMRDAAAKFLVQFPDQPAGQRLAKNEAIDLEAALAKSDSVEIGVVPIDDPAPELELAAAAPAAGAGHAPDSASTPPAPSAITPVPDSAQTGSVPVDKAQPRAN